MSHQDTDGLAAPPKQLQDLERALDCLADPAELAGVAFRRDCSGTPKALILAAVLWLWSDEKTVTDPFALGEVRQRAGGVWHR